MTSFAELLGLRFEPPRPATGTHHSVATIRTTRVPSGVSNLAK